jgi:hypothetical protein
MIFSLAKESRSPIAAVRKWHNLMRAAAVYVCSMARVSKRLQSTSSKATAAAAAAAAAGSIH